MDLLELEFQILFVREDANFDKASGRLDFPVSLYQGSRCTSKKCSKWRKCFFHKLPGTNGNTKVCQRYVKFKYQGDTFPGVHAFSEETYYKEIYPWILKTYANNR